MIFGLRCSLNLFALYDFSTKKIRLSFGHDSNLKFEVESLDVEYIFSKTLLANRIIYGETRYTYESLIKGINRHVLHKQFSCTVVFKKSLEPLEKITAKFEFDVPYFESETKIMLQKLEPHLVPEEIEKLFDQNFKESAKMSSKELKLLEKIK